MRFTETVRNQRRRVVVIGAGPAGAAADALSRGGYDVTVPEKADHLGGRTHTHRADGQHVDTGAAFITNFANAHGVLPSALVLTTKSSSSID